MMATSESVRWRKGSRRGQNAEDGEGGEEGASGSESRLDIVTRGVGGVG